MVVSEAKKAAEEEQDEEYAYVRLKPVPISIFSPLPDTWNLEPFQVPGTISGMQHNMSKTTFPGATQPSGATS